MKLLVGLGNPGPKYENTRHNLGFWVIDQLAQKLNLKLKQEKFDGLYYQTSEYILLKPQTYMNNSGECVVVFLNYFQISLDNLLVIYDDITLPLGNFNYRSRGSTGGHNGIKDIIEKLGTSKSNFKRLRVGIGYEPNFILSEWVLRKFSLAEKKTLEATLPVLLNSLEKWIQGTDFTKIMSEYKKN